MKNTFKVYITIYVCKEHVKSYSKTEILRVTDAKLRNFGPKNGKSTNCTAFHRMSDIYCLLKATQMGCVYVTYLKLRKSSFCHIRARMKYFEARRSDSLIRKSGLHSTQDGNLCKVF